MNENLLHYLWKHSLFYPAGLISSEREEITVIHPGTHNHNAGPDFLEARVKIGHQIWVGNVELHVYTSDWHKHNHNLDPNYQNIILHVVYEDDEPLAGTSFPTLELKPFVDHSILDRYRDLMSVSNPIACAAQVNDIPAIIWNNWLDRLLAERWEHRLNEWQLIWLQAGKDWRTLLYYRLAANFGFHVNRDEFLELALSIPLNVLVKHRNNLMQTEALLFGQSGLLQGVQQDDYMKELEQEYHFLRRKYQLTPLLAYRWKFMRLRPPNFPTVRIAQFAMLVHKSLELFAQLMELKKTEELSGLLDIHASAYWDHHFRFGELSKEVKQKHLGQEAISNILINTVAPMQYLYAKLQGKSSLIENSLNLLQSIKAEENKFTRVWNGVGVNMENAAESQALLQLFQEYCSPKNCLQCAVGSRLVRKG